MEKDDGSAVEEVVRRFQSIRSTRSIVYAADISMIDVDNAKSSDSDGAQAHDAQEGKPDVPFTHNMF
jgi:hypothetical protein